MSRDQVCDFPALTRELQRVGRYARGKCGDMELLSFPGLTYSDAAQLLAEQDDKSLKAMGLWAQGL